jgi:hypothetical protein
MHDMGCFSITIAVENPAQRGATRDIVGALVDTGNEFT